MMINDEVSVATKAACLITNNNVAGQEVDGIRWDRPTRWTVRTEVRTQKRALGTTRTPLLINWETRQNLTICNRAVLETPDCW